MKLEEKNIFLDDNKIKRIIYQIRNDLYIKDEELLRYINSITIMCQMQGIYLFVQVSINILMH